VRAGRLGGRTRRGRVGLYVAIVAAAALLIAAGLLVLRPPAAVVEWLRVRDEAVRQPATVWADPAAVAAHIKAIDDEYIYRPAGSYQERQVADYVAAQLRVYGYEVWEQPFTRVADDGQAVSENIVALARPAGQGAPGGVRDGVPTVLLGAPLSPESSLTATGFDDGSGLAAMLECARAVAEMQLEFNVVFAAFGGSAHGRAGSKAFCDGIASGPVAPGGLAMAIILDAVDGDTPISLIPWAGTRACPPSILAGAADAIGDATGSRVRFDTTLAFLRTVAADSSPFIVSGTPALTLTTSPSSPHFRVGTVAAVYSSNRAADADTRAMAAARAADAALAALRWAGDQAARAELAEGSRAPYVALRVAGAVVAVPYMPALAVSVLAMAAGVVGIGFAGRLIWLGPDRPRESGILSALLWTGALYAIMSAVLWTGAIPSTLVSLVRGLARPWTAYPLAHAAAAGCVVALAAVMASGVVGWNPVSKARRAPLLRIALVAQVGLVGYALLAVRAGAVVPAISLLATVAALASGVRWLRTMLAGVAVLPAAWLLAKLATGIGRVTVGDLLEVPVVLALLTAVALLPYVLSMLTLGSRRMRLDSLDSGDGFSDMPGSSGRSSAGRVPGGARAGGIGTTSRGGRLPDVLPGVVVREFRGGRGAVSAGAGVLVGRGRASLRAVLALVALVMTAVVFACPSYTQQRPKLVVATFGQGASGEAQVILESRESLKGVEVVRAAGGSTTINEASHRSVVALGGSAPVINVDARIEALGGGNEGTDADGAGGGHALVITAISRLPLAWAVAEVAGGMGPVAIAVKGADCSYALLGASAGATAVQVGDGGGTSEREPAVGRRLVVDLNRTGLTSYQATIELAGPAAEAGAGLEVVVRAGAEAEPTGVLIAGSAVTSLLHSEYTGRAQVRTAQ
jgi:hypothetical protein